MIIFNEETEDIVEERHICYYTKSEENNHIVLCEIIEKKLLHPKAKEHAYIHKYDNKRLKSFKRNDPKASAIILLEAAQNNISISLDSIMKD